MNQQIVANFRNASSYYTAQAAGYRANAVKYPVGAKAWNEQALRYDGYAAQKLVEALAVEMAAVNFEMVFQADKAILRDVSEADFAQAVVVQQKLYDVGGASVKVSPAFYAEITRRKAAATRALRASQESSRQAAGAAFEVGEKIEVHARGYWYAGEVVRIAKSGAVVCHYVSGAGRSYHKSVGADKVRKLGAK